MIINIRGIKKAAGIFILLFFSTCDNTLDPIDRDKGIYGIYGALNLNDSLNYIRVKDLNVEFTAEATQNIDVTVIFENLATGTSEVLQEGPKMMFDGIYLHNFLVEGALSPDTPYLLKAERSDGVTLSLPATSPTQPTPDIFPTNQDCYTAITVDFEPVNGGTIVWRAGFPYGPIRWATYYVIRTDDSGQKASASFTPKEQLDRIPDPQLTCHELTDNKIYFTYQHFGPGFYEKLENDPFDILASTDRFGIYYADTILIPIDTSPVCPQDC